MFGFEALEERCYGEEVEDHVDEVEMHHREEIESVHYRNDILAILSYQYNVAQHAVIRLFNVLE